MARQPQGNERASALTVLTTEVGRLAEWFRIPVEQARTGLERLVAAFAGDLLEYPRQLDRALHRFPLSLLEDALVSLPKDVAVKLIAEADLPQLARQVKAVEWLVDEDAPVYTLDELASHTEAFGLYLQMHRDYLVQTGLPPRSFRTCRWLYLNLARLYDTRTTDSLWPPDEFSDRNPRITDGEPYTWIKTPGPEITPCQYHEADYLNGMNQADADQLEANRDKLFVVKLKLTDLLIDAARRRNVDSLWVAFMKLVAESFTAQEVAFFFQMDHFYLGTDARYESDEEADPKMVPGGLTNCIEVLGHFEKEVKIGTLARTKKALPAAVIGKLIESPENGEYRWAYFNIVGKPDQARLDATLRQLFLRLDQEKDFWIEFRQRVANSLSDEVRLPVSIFVPLETMDRMATYLQNHADQKLQDLNGLSATASASRQAGRVSARFPSPDGLRWSEVTMEFVANDAIRITARYVSKRFTFAELGFKDGRKGDLHDTAWEFLRFMAQHRGTISWETDIPSRAKVNTRKKVQLINERLQTVMALEERPIPSYRDDKVYKTAFTLRMTTLEQNLANSTKDEPDEN